MKNHFKRSLSAFLALVICFGLFTTVNLTANAASADVYIVQLPRGSDPNQSGWGHPSMTFANGWHSSASSFTTVKAIGSYEASTVYCIEPGVPLDVGDTLNSKGEDFWDNYPENLNNKLTADEIKKYIGRIFVYGWTGNNNLSWNSTNSTHAQEIAELLATQYLVWETIVGDRDSNFNWVSAPSGTSNIIDMLASNHPLRSQIMTHYNRIVNSVKNHVSRPSFLSDNLSDAQIHDMTWDGSKYSITLTDNNNLLSNFTFSSTTPGVSFSVSGNKLTISMTNAPTGNVDITATKNSSVRKTTVVWTDYIISSKTSGQIQDLVSYGAEVADPVTGYVRVKVSLGRLAIIKTTQHNNGSVNGFTFEVRNSSNTLIGTYTTDSTGKIDIPNLLPGIYSVKEVNLSSDFVEPTPNPKSVTVIAGQTVSVSFDNVKKRGIITIKKTDANPTMGGYSLTGAVFEVFDSSNTLVDTITTDSAGTAQTKILPLGTYTVKETKAPYGFVLDKNVYTRTLTGSQGMAEIVYCPEVGIAEKPQVGRVNIIKTGEQLTGANEVDGVFTPVYTELPLEKAVFNIIARKDIFDVDGKLLVKAGEIVDIITTDKNGKAQSNDLHLGDYYAIEIEAPDGMVLNETEYDFSLVYGDQNEEIVFTQVGVYDERQKADVSLTKWCELPKKIPANFNPYASIVFGLYAREDILAVDGSTAIPKDGLIETITPDSSGNATFQTDLPFGSYYVKERQTYVGEQYYYYLDKTEYDLVFEYAGQDTAKVEIAVNNGDAIPNYLAGTLTISKDFLVVLNFEHATGTGAKMSALGFTKGQQWEEYTSIKVGDVKNGTFRADIIVETEKLVVGTMTAKFTDDGDLEIWYECLSGYHLEQGARLDIVNDPSNFTSDAYGDLPFRSVNNNYSGATSGYITVSAADLIERGINIEDDTQEFYVFLRLDRVAGGIYSNENRSWIDSDYTYEFMIFDLDDFDGQGYANQKAIEKAVQTDVNGILAKGIKPLETVYCNPRDSISVDLPAGKYLVAEIFRDADGKIIDNPDFVSINISKNVYTINISETTKADVNNDFSIFFDNKFMRKTTETTTLESTTEAPTTMTADLGTTTLEPTTTTEVPSTMTADPETTTSEHTSPTSGGSGDPFDINPKTGTILVTGTIQLTATPLDISGSAAYTSLDPSVATVDVNGLVTGISPGSVTIKAEYNDEEIEVTITVIPRVTSIVLDRERLEMDAAEIADGLTEEKVLIVGVITNDGNVRSLAEIGAKATVTSGANVSVSIGTAIGDNEITVESLIAAPAVTDGEVTDTITVTVEGVSIMVPVKILAKEKSTEPSSFRGTWNSTTYYQVGQTVLYNGNYYEATWGPIFSWPPTDTRYWKLLYPSDGSGGVEYEKSAVKSPTLT